MYFRLRFGFVNSINTYLRIKSRYEMLFEYIRDTKPASDYISISEIFKTSVLIRFLVQNNLFEFVSVL